MGSLRQEDSKFKPSMVFSKRSYSKKPNQTKSTRKTRWRSKASSPLSEVCNPLTSPIWAWDRMERKARWLEWYRLLVLNSFCAEVEKSMARRYTAVILILL